MCQVTVDNNSFSNIVGTKSPQLITRFFEKIQLSIVFFTQYGKQFQTSTEHILHVE